MQQPLHQHGLVNFAALELLICMFEVNFTIYFEDASGGYSSSIVKFDFASLKKRFIDVV